jgi:hypothetical protein
MRNTSKQKTLRKLAAGSLIAACALFPAGIAVAEDGGGGGSNPPGGSTPPDEGPGPSLPNIPEHPGEGLPVPIPGGGG